MMKSLAEALPEEMDRVVGLIPMYASIGPSGDFGIMMMRKSLREATSAIVNIDTVEMLRCLEDLRGFKS